MGDKDKTQEKEEECLDLIGQASELQKKASEAKSKTIKKELDAQAEEFEVDT